MGKLLILGAGGHGRVVAEAAVLGHKYEEISFLDDNSDAREVNGINIIGKINKYKDLKKEYKYAFVALGNNEIRLSLINDLVEVGYTVPEIIHPRAYVSEYSTLGIGTVILAGAVVNVNCSIGAGCILNINTTIDHDSVIEDGVHISSGVTVRSAVSIGELSIIREGACITQGKYIEKKNIINAGEVV